MTYSKIAATYLAGWLIAIAGALVVFSSIGASTANPFYVVWVLVAFIGDFTAVAGLMACLIAFVAALRKLAPLEDGSWYRLVLVLGVFSATVGGMLVYLGFHPDVPTAARRPGMERP